MGQIFTPGASFLILIEEQKTSLMEYNLDIGQVPTPETDIKYKFLLIVHSFQLWKENPAHIWPILIE